MTVRAAERESHLGRTTRSGRSLEGPGCLGAVNDSGVQLIYKTLPKARQPRIAGGLSERKWVVLSGLMTAKK
jgi:hypothetical protein